MRLLSYLLVAVLAVAFGWQITVMRGNIREAHAVTAEHDAELGARIEYLEARTLQLEIHDCGLTQYEDYSVAPQVMDWVRKSCVRAMKQRR